MLSRQKKYKIWNKKNKCYEGVYSRAYHDEYEFDSEDSALNANFHGVHHDTDKYEIHEVEICEELISRLPPKPEYVKKTDEKKEFLDNVERAKKQGADNFEAVLAASFLKTMENFDFKKYYKDEN